LSVEDFDGVFDAKAVAEELAELMVLGERRPSLRRRVRREGLADILPTSSVRRGDEHGNPVLGSVQLVSSLPTRWVRLRAQTGVRQKIRAKQIGYETAAPAQASDVMLAVTRFGATARSWRRASLV